MAKTSLTFWVDRLSNDRVLAALIGCTTDSLPPLGSYFDFMDRLWPTLATDLYTRDKLLLASWNTKKPDKNKGKKQIAPETKPKITEAIEKRLIDGKDISFNFEEHLKRFFCHSAVLPSMECGLIPREHLTVSGDSTAVHTHACPASITGTVRRKTCGISPTPMLPRAGTAAWKIIISATLCSSYPVITLNSGQTSRCSCVLPAQGQHNSVNFLVAFHELEKHMPAVSIENMCLDSAMDNSPTYRILKNRGRYEPSST